jgi:hypothetical protein
LDELDTIRKQVEFLESHMTLGMISEKQYLETGIQLANRVKELEEECGIDEPRFDPKGLLYDDQAEIFNQKVHFDW